MFVRIADAILHTSFYILLFFVPFLFYPANSELFEFNKMLATYALVVIIAGAWAIKCVLACRIIFRRTILDIPLLLFLVSQIASTYFSIDPHTSIWGYYSRSHGGLLSTITYLALYWAFVSNMGTGQVKTVIKYLLSGAFIISLWGILEHFGASPSCYLIKEKFDVDCWVQDVQTRVFATLGQPNWLAAWIVAIIPLTWTIANLNVKTQNEKLQLKTKKFWLWTGISCILFTALLFTKSRSGLLGFGTASIVFWGILAFLQRKQASNWFRPFIICNLSFVILIAVFGSPWTPSVTEVLKNNINHQPSTIDHSETGTVLETGGTESGEIRKIVWKGAINIWRAYPIFGSGVETFAYSYYQFRPIEHNMTSEWDFLYNKAHNEYLNFLATTGVVGLGAYLFLIGTFLTWSVYKLKTQMLNVKTITQNSKLQDSEPHTTYFILHTSFLAGFASILVTNFFGFSVVNVATLFFLFPAMAMVIIQNGKRDTQNVIRETQNVKTVPSFSLHVFSFAVLLFTFYVLFRLSQIWHADTLYTKAEKSKIDTPYPSIRYAQTSLNLRPDEPLYYDKLAQATSYFAVEAEEKNQHEAALATAQVSDEASLYAVTLSSYNLSLLKSRSAILTRLATVDPKYLNDSLPVREKAASLAPTDPKVHYDLGVLYSRLGQNEQARKILEKTLILKSDYGDAQNALKIIQEKF